jgi:hypothetical protein
MVPIEIVMQDNIMKKIFITFGLKGTSELEKLIKVPKK